MKRELIFCIFLCLALSLQSMPGKLLLIGGGSERGTTTGWNYIPYKWAVDNSINQRVAIIGYGPDDAWMENFFMDICNAKYAKHWDISSIEVADAQATYDSLLTYGMIFLKGGDQANYYTTYKGTKTQEAIEQIFENGGVIAGTSAGCAILSSITFSAINGTVYPIECMRNIRDEHITLKDDFLNLFPGYVFDTHFGERGRLGRLIGFMANWKYKTGENIVGVGVDDLTALAIDTNMIGTVYGTGSVNFYLANENTFDLSDSTKLIADSIVVKQLLHECTYNFETGEITGLETNSGIEPQGETGDYTILASGYELLSRNEDLLSEFLELPSENKIVIVTGSNSNYASQFQTELVSLGASQVDMVEALSSNGDNVAISNVISSAKKFLIIENSYDTFMEFMETSNGILLKSRLKKDGAIVAFVGDNSRFAGKYVINNYDETWASYYGELTFDPGLELLENTVVMGRTYLINDHFENTITGVPYAMLLKDLKYGIWVNRHCFMKYYPSNGKPYITGKGSSPVMVMVNYGSTYDFSDQTSRGDGSQTPRMASGFDNMYLHFLDQRDSIQVGQELISTALPDLIHNDSPVEMYYMEEKIVFQNLEKYEAVMVYDISGRLLFKQNLTSSSFSISKNSFPAGIYMSVFTGNSKSIEKKKVIFF